MTGGKWLNEKVNEKAMVGSWDLAGRTNVCLLWLGRGPVLGTTPTSRRFSPRRPSAAFSLPRQNPSLKLQLLGFRDQRGTMDLVAKYTSCLSKWQLNVAPGWQTVGASVLLAAGSLFIVSRALLFVRVLLSLFVLPGKPVSYQKSDRVQGPEH